MELCRLYDYKVIDVIIDPFFWAVNVMFYILISVINSNIIILLVYNFKISSFNKKI
jgi:hypothetical protein